MGHTSSERKKGSDINSSEDRNQKIILGILLVALVASGIYMVYTMLEPDAIAGTGSNYKRALESENPSDICKTPQGYTDAEWQEHMSHHPDRYAQCFS